MKVTCKTVKGATFDVTAEPSTSVSAVRSLIEAAKPELTADTLIVIHQGKILKDDDTLDGVGFGDTSFLVLMTKPAAKKKEEPKPEPEAAAAAGGASGEPSAAAAAAEPAAVKTEGGAAPAAAEGAGAAAAPASAAATSGGDAYTSTASQLMTGDALEQSISMICEMGFERAQVQRAMRAAFNNPERAVEYLMSGVPPEAEAEAGEAAAGAGGAAAAPAAPAAAPAGAAPAAAAAPAGPNAQPLDLFAPPGAATASGGAGAGAGAAGGAGAAAGGGPLDFLRSNPQFNALRSIVQANPQVLEPMLAELGRAQPDLLALINENQGEFLRLVNEPVAGGGAGAGGLAELAASLGAGGGGGGLPPGTVAVNLTAEEIEAVGRLEALGFERGAAVEAFLACDKNEALAANFLFENPDDDDEGGEGGAGNA